MNDIKEKKYAGIIYDDVANGEGVGAVFFTQGCPHHCEGCQNSQTWNFSDGMELTEEIIEELFMYYKNTPFANRLTLSGGEPFENVNVVLPIAERFKIQYPNKQLWCFTGYTLDYLQNNDIYKPLLEYVDVIVDGKFEKELRDITLEFRGSSNQHIYKKENNEFRLYV